MKGMIWLYVNVRAVIRDFSAPLKCIYIGFFTTAPAKDASAKQQR